MPSAKFDEVFKKTREIKSGPSNDDLLNLYAYAKIALGEDIEKAPKPGMFDVKGKAKRNKWQLYIDEGVTAEKAEEEYIKLGESLISKYLET